MSEISIIINVDTRPVCNEFQGMWKGVRSRDFLDAGIYNKRLFFKGFDTEVIVFVDEHEPLTIEEYDKLKRHSDCLVIRKHSKCYRGADPFSAFNDVNYIQALSMARGEYIAHFDGDMAAFTKNQDPINWMLDEVNSGRHKFVCYPSCNAPAPVHAPEYADQWWASTRFFFCKREEVDITALEHAIRDNNWFYATYGMPNKVNPWVEGFLGEMAGYSVIYPKVVLDQWAVFPWMRYRDGLLSTLNDMPYGEVASALYKAGGDGIFHDGVDCNLMGIKP